VHHAPKADHYKPPLCAKVLSNMVSFI
jgi:hypothetical protein